MTIRSTSFTRAFFEPDQTTQAPDNSSAPGAAGQPAPVYFRHGDDANKFREFMANRPLFERCKTEYRALLDRLATFAEQAGPQLSPPLTETTLRQIQQNIRTLQHTIANPPEALLPGTALMYGLGKERFHELAELIEERSASPHEVNRQRHLARRMDVLQTLAPHLGVCSGGVITALEEALASLRPQNMGIAGKARVQVGRYLRNTALAQVKSKGNNMPGREVHRAVAIYNKLAPAMGLSTIADQYADWPVNQPTEEDLRRCEKRIAAHLKPSDVLRPLAEAYLDEARGTLANSSQAGNQDDDVYVRLHSMMKNGLDAAYGPVDPYSVLISQSDTQDDPDVARYPDLLAANFTRKLEIQGLVETGDEVSLGEMLGISYVERGRRAGSNKRRKLENKDSGEIRQWAGLYWLKKGEEKTELSPGQLLDVRPYQVSKDLKEKGIADAQQAEIFQNLAEHIFASRERENIRKISSDWLYDLVHIIEQFSAETRQGLLHAAVMLACTYNHPRILRLLHQMRQQPNLGQTAHGQEDDYLNNPAPTGELPMTVAARYGHDDILALLAQKGANINIRDSEGLTPVLHAVMHGRAAALQTLIALRASIDDVDANGIPTVSLAAAKNHAPVVALLMDASPAARSNHRRFDIMVHAARQRSDALMEVLKERETSLEVKNEQGITPLLSVIWFNDTGAAQFLVRHGAGIESPDLDGNTPLLVAAVSGNLDIVKFLLEKQANLDHLNNRQSTALMFAAMHGNHSILEALVKAKAAGGPQALQEYVNHQDSSGRNALMYAAANGDPRSLRILIDAHAGLDQRDLLNQNALVHAAASDKEEAINVLLETKAVEGEPALKAFVNGKNGNGVTPLMKAAEKGNPQIVRLFVKFDADLDAVDNEGMTALSYAAKTNIETVKALLEAKEAAGVDVLAAYVNHTNHVEETALMTAAIRGNPEIITALIEANAEVDAQDNKLLTALSYAAHWGRMENVETLILAGADVNLSDDAEETPLIKAIRGGHVETARVLILAGALTYMMDELDNTPLAHAASSGSETLVRELLANYADLGQAELINQQNTAGMTPLMDACANGHANIVEVLAQVARSLVESGELQEPLDIKVKDVIGMNALMHACANGHANIVDALAQVARSLAESKSPGVILDIIEDKDAMGMNALMHASAAGSAAAASALISQGATLNFGDDERATAILHAARNGHASVIHTLIEAVPASDILAADVNLDTSEGESPLMVAALGGHITAVNVLLAHPRIDVDAIDDNGRNALMYAASRQPADPRIIASLLPRTRDIYAIDNKKMDVFQHAVKSRSLAALKVLIAADYDPKLAITRTGPYSALELAKEGNDQAVLHYLTQDLGLK